MDGETLALLCASAASDRKAEDISILDLRGISSFADFFVICSGTSDPQVKAIASAVRDVARTKAGRNPRREDGMPVSQWVAVDFDDVIVHVFHTDRRDFYDLESLWQDARRVPFGA